MTYRVPFSFALILVGSLLHSYCAAAQRPVPVPPLELLYVHTEQVPRLPDGTSGAAAIEDAIRRHLTYQRHPAERPLQAYDQGIVTFTIGADGRVRDARVLSELGIEFDRALLAAVARLPRFSPGRQEGQPVAVRYTLDVGASVPNKYNRQRSGGDRMPPDWPEIEKWVPEPPRLPGGQYLGTALDLQLVYPPAGPRSASSNPKRQTQMVRLGFTVDKTGRVVDALVQGSGGLAYDRAALKALGALRFTPGRRDGQPVPVHLEHTVTFPTLTPAAVAAIQAAKVAAAQPEALDAAGRLGGNENGEVVAFAPPPDSTKIYQYVEQMPALPDGGGNQAVVQRLQRDLEVPAEVREGRLEGRVFAYFVVGPSGVVHDAQIRKGLSPAADAAVLAAIARLPRFRPGKQNGQAVAVSYIVPVSLWGPNHVFDNQQVPQPATFPAPSLDAYVAKNLRVPAVVKKENLSGVVVVGYVVGAEGRVRDAKVERALCTSCDEEALRLVRTMPAWTPARNAQGQPVPVGLSLVVAMPPRPVAPPNAAPITAQRIYPGGSPGVPGSAPVANAETKVYAYVEQMPQLPTGGGSAAIGAAIRQAIPAATAAACPGGRVFVAFTVQPDGTVTDAKIVKGLNNACDEATLAAVGKLPRFVPGKQNGRAVAVSFTVPVQF